MISSKELLSMSVSREEKIKYLDNMEKILAEKHASSSSDLDAGDKTG